MLRFLRSLSSRLVMLRLMSGTLLLFSSVAFAQSSPEWPLTDFDTRSVELDEIMSGGPPRDGIPPLDAPEFVNTEQAATWLKNDEPVVVFEHAGDARAYPLQILIYHEIANDVVGGKPVSITFCPLCNASIVFDRNIDGETLDFGTTGRLRKSDLVMYDRQTESWWQQFTGIAIIGKYTDTELTQLPSQIVSFKTFADIYPGGKVLSRETGFRRSYGNNPYPGYDSINNRPFLYRGELDDRLPPMERILSIPDGENHQLIPLSALESHSVFNISVSGQAMVILASSNATSALDKSSIADSREIPAAAVFSSIVDGQALSFKWVDGAIKDRETDTTWNAIGHGIAGELKGLRLQQIDRGVHFAFAWLAFDPDAKILRP